MMSQSNFSSPQPDELTVEVSLRILEKAIENDSVSELEDWLLVNDSEFIDRMRKAKTVDLADQTKPLSELKKRLSIE